MNRTSFAIFLVSLFVILGINGCAKKQTKSDQPFGRSGVEGARGETDSNLKTVYFDYDKYTVRDDQKVKVKESGDYLKVKSSWKVQIEGHTDERGSNEYNLALGDRRANAVRAYLLDLGVPGDRITIVSYGEERSAKDGGDEVAWAENRRAEFVVTGK